MLTIEQIAEQARLLRPAFARQVGREAKRASGGLAPGELRQRFQEREARHQPSPAIPVTDRGRDHLASVALVASPTFPIPSEDFRRVVWEVMQAKGSEVTAEQRPIIQKLAYYFSGNVFPGGYDLSKGIFLFGGCGAGKTSLFKIFQQARLRFGFPLQINHTPTIYTDFLASGNVDFGPYLKKERCFDDAGAEQMEILSFGNRIHILPQLIILRYETMQRDGALTHFTSNLTPAEMVKRIGFDDRVKSRMNEMFNIVHLPGDDWRMPKAASAAP